MDKLILIDGNSLVNRAFYATPLFSTKDGLHTNGVMGFVKLYIKILNDLKPKYAIVAFDVHAPTFRHKMYKSYKGTRKPMPEELIEQMPVLKDCLALMGVKMVEKAGLEADDIIGTLSRKFPNVESYIYTGDRDSFQLVNDTVNVCYTLRGVSDLLVLTKENFAEKNGLVSSPEQIVDIKSLMGDASDNIPGVPGIGEKTAKSLLSKYLSLDGIYEHIDEIKGVTKTKLEDNKDLAYLSHTLATIDVNADLDVELEDCRVTFPFSQKVKQKFAALEFRLLYANDSLYEQTIDAKQPLPVSDIEKIEKITLSQADDFLFDLKDANEFSVVWGDVKSIYVGKKEYQFTEMVDLLSAGLSQTDQIKILKYIFENKNNHVVLLKAKDMMHELKNNEISFDASFDDVSILRYLVDYTGREEALGFILDNYGLSKETPAYSLFLLSKRLHEKIKRYDMGKLYSGIELPLCEVLCQAEYYGISVDTELLTALGERYRTEIDRISDKIYCQAGETAATLNLNSPAQLGKVLFDKLGLPHGKKGKSGSYSVSVEVLESLRSDHPIVEDVLDYRQLQKLNSTYIEGLKPYIVNGKVHTRYTQTITSTGRLSSVNPNLQNIPVRTEEGRELRKLFVAEKGHVLVDADYSQIELRLMAHLSRCKALIEAYKEGKDIHRDTASKVFGVPESEVTSEMRRKAKIVNFGIMYGESAFGLAKSLNISAKEGADFIDRYFSVYPEIKRYLNETVEEARENGFTATIFKRRREFPELKSSNFNIRSAGERAAMNMPLQGSCADIIKLSMIAVNKELKERKMKSKLLLQVHDELILESPEEEAEEGAKILKQCMENVVSLRVPLTVDVNIGRCWYDAK